MNTIHLKPYTKSEYLHHLNTTKFVLNQSDFNDTSPINDQFTFKFTNCHFETILLDVDEQIEIEEICFLFINSIVHEFKIKTIGKTNIYIKNNKGIIGNLFIHK